VGFTLAEILVALGILAIGMSMVAAIFPAAMEFNRDSTNKTLGGIICENGLILSELALTSEAVTAALDKSGTPSRFLVLADDRSGNDVHISKDERRYPTGDTDSRTGFAMMARKISTTGSTYQLITVAYRKTAANNTVGLVPVSCTFEPSPNQHIIKSVSPTSSLKIGTPLINRDTGQFAFVDSIHANGGSGTLNIDQGKRDISGGSSYYVLVEMTASGSVIGGLRRSPAIEAMSKVTGLKHDLNPAP
jgi:prepilin-type N-terminal cleavage/methylation domain-containing protein